VRPSDDAPGARFGQLVSQTRRDLLAYALRRTHSPEDAADVVADTYLIAWRKLDSFPEGDKARLWLFGVARNVILRGASRERALQTVVDRLARTLREGCATANPAGDERTAVLRRAVMALPEQQREVLLLTAWEGLAPREVAAVTGAPVNLVRVRLHRARSRLKRELTAARQPVMPSPVASARCAQIVRRDPAA